MPQPDTVTDTETFINVRKLAALDIVFQGPRFILVEFGVGVFLPLALGLVSTVNGLANGHGGPTFSIVFGSYLLSLSLNYVPLLLYAIAIVRRKSAREEVAHELAYRDHYARKYTVQQLLLLVPLFIPILAVYQEMRKRSSSHSRSR